MKLTKKITSLILAVIICVTLVPIPVMAADRPSNLRLRIEGDDVWLEWDAPDGWVEGGNPFNVILGGIPKGVTEGYETLGGLSANTSGPSYRAGFGGGNEHLNELLPVQDGVEVGAYIFAVSTTSDADPLGQDSVPIYCSTAYDMATKTAIPWTYNFPHDGYGIVDSGAPTQVTVPAAPPVVAPAQPGILLTSDVKPGKYTNDAVINEFSWGLNLNTDNSFVFNLMDYHGYYDMKGTWTADSAGNITLNADTGNAITLIGGGTDTLTIPVWPFGEAMNNTQLYFEVPTTTPITAPVVPAQPTVPVTPPVVPPTTPAQPTIPAQSGMTVMPTPSKVFVNGMEMSFEAYHIEGSNYFKLRDIGFVLNGTAKQFNLGYDNATAAITILPGQPYIPAGGEMMMGDGQAKPATLTASKIYLNGQELNLTVYNIAGSNFFKLVDLMGVLNVGVTYNSTTGAISIDTNTNFMGVGTVTDPVTPVTLPAPAPIATPAPAPIQTPTPPVVTPTTPSTGDTALSKGLYFYPIVDVVDGKFYQLADFQLEFTDQWSRGTDISLSDITDVVVYIDGVPNEYTLDFVDDVSHARSYPSSLVRYDAGVNANRFTQYPATYMFSFRIKGVEFTLDILTSFTVSADGTVQYDEK